MSLRESDHGADRRGRLDRVVIATPFPWFGGKSRISSDVWRRFGPVQNYVEPFFGSGAVLLGRPRGASGIETVNDKDGFVANFWRAVSAEPEAVAVYADWPVNENDQHARHSWLVSQRETLTSRLEGDPEFFDAKIAGWWVWGINCWIGSGWCSGDGPWRVDEGQLVHLGNAGRGVHRQLVHLGDAGRGLIEWMEALARRLRYVRVCCGDWTRVCGPTPTTKQGLTAVFLDPPYSDGERQSDIYSIDDSSISSAVATWALEHGDDPMFRIALCGYDTEHVVTRSGWTTLRWKARGGYGSQGQGRGRDNSDRETVWFSPHCLRPQDSLFAQLEDDDGVDAAKTRRECEVT